MKECFSRNITIQPWCTVRAHWRKTSQQVAHLPAQQMTQHRWGIVDCIIYGNYNVQVQTDTKGVMLLPCTPVNTKLQKFSVIVLQYGVLTVRQCVHPFNCPSLASFTHQKQSESFCWAARASHKRAWSSYVTYCSYNDYNILSNHGGQAAILPSFCMGRRLSTLPAVLSESWPAHVRLFMWLCFLRFITIYYWPVCASTVLV